MDQQSPREEIERARRGDQAAFARLVRSYERTALAIAYAVVGDASAASDVTQEAFLRVWQRLGELSDAERFGGWLGRIVRNLAADHVRKRRPAENINAAAQLRLAVDSTDEIDRADQRREINSVLSGLDELTRAAVALKYYEDLSSKQIGELLELSPAAVDMRLSRARAELREKLSHLAERGRAGTERVASDAAQR